MDIAAWLRELGLERYERAFQDSDIVPTLLPELTDQDLKELGVSLGHRRLLLKAIRALAGDQGGHPPAQVAHDSYPPPQPAPRSDAERRQLTVLFSDLVGSTELSARLDPEDMGEVIRVYQQCCADAVRRWDGHVAKYMGDGVLAWFGFPWAHEDDAERAVRAALELTAAVGRLSAGDGTPLAARVGIATGLVLVGEMIGPGAAQEEAVVGETPNLAARLQTLAAPGRVVIAQSTRRLLGGLFELADLGPVRLKGFAQTLAAFRVEGQGRAEGRFEALRGQHLTPLVGREHELAILMERWAWARDGDGQVVLLSGEAGIGKSRLIRALRQELSGERHVALSHFCSPHHTHSALYPIITQLEGAAGFGPDDESETKLAKLTTLLGQATEQLDDAIPLLAALLNIPAGDRYPALNLSPQRQKQRTLEVLIEQLAGLARDRPVLELYEDVQWVDPSTMELLDLLVERVRALPVLAVFTYRPEFSPPWTGQAHVTALPLNRLGRRQGAAMVVRLTGGKALPDEVLEQIVARTDGVPLFVEELTKTVLESNLLQDREDRYELTGPLPSLAIPATLQDSLMARLDRLAAVKEVAQIAAVIGREFGHELLAAIVPLAEPELASSLDQLVQAELIFCCGAPPQATYRFKHSLVQDTAYQSLLRSRRQQLHAQIARALTRDFPSIAETRPELLAHHFAAADLREEAIGYWQRAGELAAEGYANVEAIAHLSKGLELVRTLPESGERDRRELDLLTLLGPLLTATKGYAAGEVETTYLRSEELCRDVGDPRLLFQIVFGLRSYYEFRGELFKAGAEVKRCLDLACELGDPELLIASHRAIGGNAHRLGEFTAARGYLEQSIAIGSSSEQRLDRGHKLADARVLSWVYLSRTLGPLGYLDQALHASDEAIAMAERLGHPYTLAESLHFASGLHLALRDPAGTKGLADRLMALCRENGFGLHLAHAMLWRGWADTHERQSEHGIEQIRDSLAQFMAIGSAISHTHGLIVLADAYRELREARKGLAALTEAAVAIGRTDERRHDAEIHRLRAELTLLLPAGDHAQAAASFQCAIEVAGAQQAKLWELRAATSLARLRADQGERRQAYDLLVPVYDWFTEGFDATDLKDAKALLDAVA